MSTINIKKIKPSYNYIQTTADTDTEAKGFMRDPYCQYSEIQRIISVGPLVTNYKVGDLIMVSYAKYRRTSIPKGSAREELNGMQELVHYTIPTLIINDVEYLILTDSDISLVIEDYD